MNRTTARVLTVLLSSAFLSSCAQKQRTLEETKPKVTINAVTNSSNNSRPNVSNTALNTAKNTNTTTAKITLPKRPGGTANTPVNYNPPPTNNEAYNPDPITVPRQDPVTEVPATETPATQPSPATTTVPAQPSPAITTVPAQQPPTETEKPQSEENTSTTTRTQEQVETTSSTQTAEVTPVESTSKHQQVGDAVVVERELNVYGTAYDAASGQNAVYTYGPGTYYIYSISSNGAVNISTDPGYPGAWVGSDKYLDENKVDEARGDEMRPPAVTTTPGNPSPETTQAEETHERFTSGQKVTLGTAATVYGTAYDAKNGINPLNEFAAGEYYIVKYSNGAVNISLVSDVPGGWIASDTGLTENADSGNAAPTTVPSDTTGQTPEDQLEATGRFALGTKVATSEPLYIYGTASDAINRTNPIATYNTGEYYVVKYSDGAVNISLSQNAPGGWISPGATLTKVSAEIPSDLPGFIEVSGDTVKLKGRVTVYGTAADAKDKVNPKYSYDAGDYHLFKTADGAINISTQEGSPGGWINYNTEGN